MAPSGPLYPSISTDQGGTNPWSNPNNVFVQDGLVATANFGAFNKGTVPTDNLQITGFNFAIPSTGIIDGIYVEMYGSGGGNANGMSLTAGNGSGKNINWPSNDWIGYGGAADLWGTTNLTPALINASTFGVTVNSATTSPSGGSASIDCVRITVYWHTKPALVNYRCLYQVFNQAGQYLGLLPNVTSEFTYAHDINTSGTQTTITCAVNTDTAVEALSTIDDQTGIPITDESGNDLYTERQTDVIGNSNPTILFKNGNKVKIYEVTYWHPNGRLRFSGEINRVEANIESGNDQIKLLVYSDGADMNNTVITGGGTLDQSQTSQNSALSIYGPNPAYRYAGQTFTVGSGITTLEAITVMLNTGGAAVNVTLAVYSAPGGTLLASTTLNVNCVNPTAIQFQFVPILAVTAATQYYFEVQPATGSPNISVYYQNTAVYGGGSFYEDAYGGSESTPPIQEVGDLYFQTFYNGNTTTVSYGSVDPSNMLLDIVDRYNGQGGKIIANSSSVALTGLSNTYTFVVASVLDGVQEALALAPPDWFWTVDLATDILTFNQASNATSHLLIRGQHISSLKAINTIENIVNTLYFSGGIPSGLTQNIYSIYQNAQSVANFGQRLDRQSDNRVTVQATADAIGNSSVSNTEYEQNQTQVVVQYPNFDTSLFHPGDIIKFAGYGNFIDTLSLQIVHIDYKPSQVTLTLGMQPPRQQIQVQQILDGLVAQQTIANPPTPA